VSAKVEPAFCCGDRLGLVLLPLSAFGISPLRGARKMLGFGSARLSGAGATVDLIVGC